MSYWWGTRRDKASVSRNARNLRKKVKMKMKKLLYHRHLILFSWVSSSSSRMTVTDSWVEKERRGRGKFSSFIISSFLITSWKEEDSSYPRLEQRKFLARKRSRQGMVRKYCTRYRFSFIFMWIHFDSSSARMGRRCSLFYSYFYSLSSHPMHEAPRLQTFCSFYS